MAIQNKYKTHMSTELPLVTLDQLTANFEAARVEFSGAF